MVKINEQNQNMLRYLILKAFIEGARSTNFYKGEEFSGFDHDDIRIMLYSLVNVGDIRRIDFKTTNGAGYMTTKSGVDRMVNLESELDLSEIPA